MDNEKYLALIDDTLSYVKSLLPSKQKEIKKIPLPPIEIKPTPSPKITLSPPPKPVFPSPSIPKAKETKVFIKLEPLPPPIQEPTEGIRKILKEIDPSLYLHESVPSDHRAKKIKESWKEKRDNPAIPILFQGDQYRPFISRIAKAIDIVYGSCRLIEITPDKKWDLFLESENLKLIIAPDRLIFATKGLLPFYQENPQQKSRKLGKVPLLLLPDLSLYYKDPYLKRALWNVITNTVESLK